MNPLLEQFLQEARENLGFIDQNLENIGSDDPELLNAVFRAAHTLKGGSGIVGFESVKEITHHAEDLLDMLRGGKLEYRDSMTEALYDAFDEVVNLIEAAEESEEIVDADSRRLDIIISKLNAEMGKTDEIKAQWSVPFAPISELDTVINMPMPFMKNQPRPLPFKLEAFTQEACDTEQLYAISFDVDDSCMVYGNDPVYTLSLLGDQVIGIHTCMSENSAKSILSGMDDSEGLTLQTQITAFVFGLFSEIEDALFNFMDELQIEPLDVTTLLEVSEGEEGHQLDVLRELHVSPDRGTIRSAIEKVLPLIGNETIQYHQLVRLSEILDAIADADLPKLGGFFASLDAGNRYQYNGTDALLSEENLPQAKEPETAPAIPEAPKTLKTRKADEAMKESLKNILQQQYRALETVGDQPDGLMRAIMILERVQPWYPEMLQLQSKDDAMAWLAQELDMTLPDAAIAEAVSVVEETAPAVGAPVMETVPAAVSPVETLEEVLADETAMTIVTPRRNAVKEDKKGSTKTVIGKTVKIEQESIDHLMNIVGELLVAKNSLPYLADSVLQMNGEMIKRAIMEKYTFINRLSEQLQDLIMSMRMLPISYVFDRYPKLVREISKNLGKKVKLIMNGGETKLDKNMIEMLADPMIHIMRNSLDHGIETPDIRLKKGKSDEGLVSLNAYAQSDKIIIEIIDDGAGINVDRVVQKVLEKELLTLDQIDAMSDKEKAELVMLPGLSTADAISEYSGRGVGMDVVRKSIEGFGGSISIATRPNQGTTITLSIPVSLAVTSLLHVTMSGIHYGLPMENVNEIVKVDAEQIEYLHNEPFVYIRGEVIPLLFIKSMLDEEPLADKSLPIVVLSIKGNLLAVVVNDLLGQLDVVQKPLEGVMEHHPLFSGTALLGNGQIIMVLDPLGILGIAHQLKVEYEKVG